MEVFINSDATVFRKIDDEVVVVQLDSGKFFYFNAEIEPVLSELTNPRRVDFSALGGSPFRNVLDLLERECIVTRIESANAADLSLPEGLPSLIRQGEIGVDTLPSVSMLSAPPPPS